MKSEINWQIYSVIFIVDNVFLVASGGPATDYYEGAIEAQIPCLSEFANVKLKLVVSVNYCKNQSQQIF